MNTISDELLAKTQQLIDKQEIESLMAKYCHGIDKRQEALFMSIWAEDSVYELPRGEASGIEEIRQLVHKVWREVPKCHHHITNPLIELDGETAKATTDVFYYRQSDDGVLQLLSGVYSFAFRKVSGAWKATHLKFSSFETVSPMFKSNIRG